MRKNKLLYLSLVPPFLVMILAPSLSAGLFGPSKYEKCMNEKVATGLKLKYCYKDKVNTENELALLKKQYQNEAANLKSRITDLENSVDSLKKRLALCKNQRSEEKKLAKARIGELEKTIDILKKRSSRKEKDLLNRIRAMEKRYEKSLKDKMNELQAVKEKCLKDIGELKNEYSVKIARLEGIIRNLNNELSTLKKLTKKQKDELDRMANQEKELEKQLQSEIKKGEIRLKKFHNKLIINIDNRISFDSGSAKLKKDVFPALRKIGVILNNYPENRIVIEGHTDTDKVLRGGRFRDNWQLSTERALSVLRYILKNKDLDKSRFSAAGFGEYNPIVPNNTSINKALNRRVDIVVIPRITKK